MVRKNALLSAVILLCVAALPAMAVTAFPGAQGFAANITGGRGGTVYHVTNLNDSGTGSFRDAVGTAGRTVVFDVGGVIHITSPVSFANNITVVGQTAPGGGIAVYGDEVSLSSHYNIIIRYLTVRMGIAGSTGDKALNMTTSYNIMLDHVTIAWGRWDTFGISSNAHDITLEDCIMAEGIDPQRFGGLIDSSDRITLARNFFINNQSRNPKGKGNLQYINNIVYNWGSNGYGGGHSGAVWYQDLINNYFIAGPSSSIGNILTMFTATDTVYNSGNYVDLDLVDTNGDGLPEGRLIVASDFIANGSDGISATFISAAHNVPPVAVPVMTAAEAFPYVLDHAGNSLHRDSADQRLVTDAKSLGTLGAIISSESLVGGQPAISGGTPPTDTDNDGMPDFWETAMGLSVTTPDNNGDADGDGYTNLENYLNWLAAPHARVVNGDPVDVGLGQFTSSFAISPTYTVSGATYGTVSLLADGQTAHFTPTAGYSGLAKFDFTVTSGSTTTGTVSVLVQGTGGVIDLSPDPMTWASVPAAAGLTSITMTATTAVSTGGVEYYFTCTAGGGHDSAWQTSPTYIDSGLASGATYTYTAKARDKVDTAKVTVASPAMSATTSTMAISPDPMTWASAPAAGSTTSITMTATTAVSSGGVEYYFTCTAGGGHNSAWQTSPTYIDSPLVSGATYTYTAKARDRVDTARETAASPAMSATTSVAPPHTDGPLVDDPVTVGLWHMEPINGSGSTATTPDDVSVTGRSANNLQVGKGNAVISLAAGQSGFGQALNFGTDGRQMAQGTTAFPTSQEMRVEYWMWIPSVSMLPLPTSAGGTGAAIMYVISVCDSGSTNEILAMSIDTTATLFATFKYTDGTSLKPTIPLYTAGSINRTGKWLHVIAYNQYSAPAKAVLSVDDGSGPVVSTLTGAKALSTAGGKTIYIGQMAGKTTSTPYRGLRGLLDEMKISTTANYVAITPSPNPMTWSSAPAIADTTSVTMTATTATSGGGVEYYFTCTAGGGHSSAWQASATYTDTELTPGGTYTYTVNARDAANTSQLTSASSPASVVLNTAPTPNPMTWATLPNATDIDAITMTATTASDLSGVEYYFHCTTAGGHDSAWQDSSTYTDTGLAPSTSYTYQVKARDKSISHNETGYSSPASAFTAADDESPTPDPMTWAIEPNATGIDTITMTATTATDISGVEYFFANITDPNHNSAWQDSTTYTDTGLVNNTQYTYAVIARDKSIGQNETDWSSQASATTFRYACTSPIASDLDGNCQVDFLDLALFGNTWAGDAAAWTQLTQFAADWLLCNRNPAGECWQ